MRIHSENLIGRFTTLPLILVTGLLPSTSTSGSGEGGGEAKSVLSLFCGSLTKLFMGHEFSKPVATPGEL